jgi:3-methyladenine DNA glycosylase AlkD
MPAAGSHAGSPTAAAVRAALAAAASPERAQVSARFFKTGPGQYGEGDKFWGVTVPQQRKIARACRGLALNEVALLLGSEMHEERLTGVLILVDRYQRGDDVARQEVFDFYLRHLRHVNNWDIVDSSAPYIVGVHLRTRDRALLYRLARSRVLWERRVAMISTLGLVAAGEHEDAFGVARLLLEDEHDLMHKAVGWVLREVGKRVGADLLRGFLGEHARHMPRTALRYSIEHFTASERKKWLAV